MSWESTAEYYRLLNQGVAERLGGLHSARLVMHSVDFAEIPEMQQAGHWRAAGSLLAEAAAGLERVGAEAIVLATNTMHQVATDIERAIEIPLIHIVDPTGEALARHRVRRAGLLGTRYTMELPQEAVALPVFDTTVLHAAAAVAFSLTDDAIVQSR